MLPEKLGSGHCFERELETWGQTGNLGTETWGRTGRSRLLQFKTLEVGGA